MWNEISSFVQKNLNRIDEETETSNDESGNGEASYRMKAKTINCK